MLYRDPIDPLVKLLPVKIDSVGEYERIGGLVMYTKQAVILRDKEYHFGCCFTCPSQYSAVRIFSRVQYAAGYGIDG